MTKFIQVDKQFLDDLINLCLTGDVDQNCEHEGWRQLYIKACEYVGKEIVKEVKTEPKCNHAWSDNDWEDRQHCRICGALSQGSCQ